MKKKNIFIISLILLFITFPVNAESINVCNRETVRAFIFIGEIIKVIKIVVPVLIIILGMVDFARAIISSDENALKISTKSLVIRMICGIAIFFVPTMVYGILNTIVPEDFQEYKDSVGHCAKCMFGECSEEFVNTLPEK